MDEVEGYLLDTNIISLLVRPNDPIHAAIRANFATVSVGPIFLPVIALAEIEFGLAKSGVASQGQAETLRAFFHQYPMHLGVDDNTVEPYALLRAQIWRSHGTPSGRGHKEKVPEELTDRVSGKALGIDERDLLIASVAAQYTLVLVTNDQNEGMMRIEQAARELEAAGQPIRLRIDYWPKPI